jgi:hypothetical protein
MEKTYESRFSIAEIQAWLTYAEERKAGFWIKTKTYEVKRVASSFAIKKRGAGINGTIYPWVKGEILDGNPVKVQLSIRPAYFLLAFLSVIFVFLLRYVWVSNKMTINGVHREAELSEKIFITLFLVALPELIGYFQAIRPVCTAEIWISKKLHLTPA